MQRTLLSVLLATAVACSAQAATTSPAAEDSTARSSPRPTAEAGIGSGSPNDAGEDEGLLGIDLSTPQTGSAGTTGVIDGVVVDTEDAHDHGGEFLGPLAWPDRPVSGDDPLEHIAWLGTVLLNTHANQPFDSRVFEGMVADPLLVEFEAAFTPSHTGRPVADRGVLVDSWVIDSTATSTRVETVAVFERTSGIGDVQFAGFDFVYIDATLALDASSTWIAVEVLVSS